MGVAAESSIPPSLNPNWAVLKKTLKGRSSNPSTDPGSFGKPPSLLGKRKERSGVETTASLAVPAVVSSSETLKPTCTDCSLTNEIAMDCEMVGVGSLGTKSAIARVVLVNAYGNVVYDNYVRPLERVVDFRTRISGIRPRHLKQAKDFRTVQNDVSAMIKGRTLVGHALHNDLKGLLMSHPSCDLRDSASYQPFLSKEGRRRALRDLASQILGVTIQQGEHCPVEDARAAMMIFQRHKKKWEKHVTRELKRKMHRKDGCRRNKKKKESIDG